MTFYVITDAVLPNAVIDCLFFIIAIIIIVGSKVMWCRPEVYLSKRPLILKERLKVFK